MLYLEDTARDLDLSGKGRYWTDQLSDNVIRHHGQAHQEPLGAAHHPRGGNLYVGNSFLGWIEPLLTFDRVDQVAAAVSGFFWPKIFWDFLTKTLDPAVKPAPILQTINLIFGLILIAWEWPLGFLAGSGIHRSLEARLAFLPLTALAAALIYQGTNAAIYQVIGLAVYFWAYSEGEVCAPAVFISRWQGLCANSL